MTRNRTKMQIKQLILTLTLILLLSTFVSAQKEDSIKLLALAESGNISRGAVADLILEIQPGRERVFLDTFPLTKTTTQVSMRFAQQIACDQMEIDCSNLDFFYTIRAPKGIVGGPSAGSAAAVLTAAMLKDIPLKKDVAMTGTIHSGGMIGAVGGLNYKIKAASENGIKKVLIPKGTSQFKFENKTIDLIEFGKNLSVEVKEVATFEEALSEMSPKFKFEEPNEEIVVKESYNKIMKNISDEICGRNTNILSQTNTNITNEVAQNFSKLAINASQSGKYYSSASLCFRSNVILKEEEYKKQNFTGLSKIVLSALISKINSFEDNLINRNLTSITDVQTLMAVQERVLDAKEVVVQALIEKDASKSASLFAFASERLFSAQAWSRFFENEKNDGKNGFVLNIQKIKTSCENKISEAEESYNSLTQYIPDILEKQRKELQIAYASLTNQSYVQCLYQAAKAKAEINTILGMIGSNEEAIKEQLNTKIQIARRAIIKAQKKRVFPLLSYAYYEYADSLKSIDIGSASLFAEYALEFSNLDIYFDSPKKLKKPNFYLWGDNLTLIEFYISGLLSGVLLALIYVLSRKTHNSKKKIQRNRH